MQKETQPKDIKYFVRIANTDLVGSKSIYHALRKIKGISFMFANAICSVANIAKDKKAGRLSESEIKKIDEVLKEPSKFNLNSWLFNRKKDHDTGEDKHLLTSDLDFTKEFDIRKFRDIKLKDFHKYEGCSPDGIYTKSIINCLNSFDFFIRNIFKFNEDIFRT